MGGAEKVRIDYIPTTNSPQVRIPPVMSKGLVSHTILVAWRALRLEPLHSLIAIAGLSVGMVCSALIGLYVWNQWRYDRQLPDPDHTYRIVLESLKPEQDHRATTPFPLVDALLADQGSEIKAATRLFNFHAKQVSLYLPETDRRFSEERFLFVDSLYADVFGAEFVSGDAARALAAPMSLVLTESAASRLFGDEDPIGQAVRFEGRITLNVTGVIRDPDPRTHSPADMLASMSSLTGIYQGGVPQSWSWSAVWTYVRFQPSVDRSRIDEVLRRLGRDRQPEPLNTEQTFALQKVRDIWLRSELESEIRPVNSEPLVLLIGIVGLSVLMIASVNLVNLAVARIDRRRKEIAIRKVMGAGGGDVFAQFMTESAMATAIAAMSTWLLLALVQPLTADLFGIPASIRVVFDPVAVGMVAVSALLAWVMTGVYPAWRSRRQDPLTWIRQAPDYRKPLAFQHLLMVAQFAVALVLLAGSQVILSQLERLKRAPLGFETEGVVMLPVANTRLIFFYDEFRARLASEPAIRSVTAMNRIIGTGFDTFDYSAEGDGNDLPTSFPYLMVMPGFDAALDIPIVAGRAFSDDFATDATESVMVNESMVRRMGWGSAQEALGKWVVRDDFRYRVIGVVRDFQASHLRNGIEPMMLEMPVPRSVPTQIHYILVRFDPAERARVMATLETLHAELDPRRLFRPFALSDELDRLYANENRLSGIILWFSLISVVLAGLGMFAMVTQAVERRRREMSIRRVLGAGTSDIVRKLTLPLAGVLAAAAGVALPVWWWLADRWLSTFRMPASPQALDFLVPIGLLVLVAGVAVAGQLVSLIRTRPVDSLRHD